ncbi:MAG: class I SAM-dependent methyltransferase, partial [Candidatus Heimdallarchaeota archaeon]|nr:class I SAM-dependent methyltransferase [Candidatus Heimdallarchaeota archaeon]
SPVPSSSELQQIAEEWAIKHHAGKNKLKWEGNQKLQQIVYAPRIKQFQKYWQTGKILDVGCSTGDFLEYIKGYGWDVYGCELSQHSSEFARKRLNCDIRCDEFEKSEFPSAFFDVVTMWDVIEHVIDPTTIINEALRILQPGGLLALITPNYNSLTRRVIFNKWEALIPPRHLCVFNEKTIRKLISDCGGKVVTVQTSDINPFELVSGLTKHKKDLAAQRQINIGKIKNLFIKHHQLASVRTILNGLLNLFKLGDLLEVHTEKKH